MWTFQETRLGEMFCICVFFPTWFVNKLNSETQPEPVMAQISLDFSSHFSAAVQESLLSIQD